MRVSVLLWAQMRIAAGREKIEIDMADGARLEEALDRLYAQNPALAVHRPFARAAVGNEYVDGDPILQPGDEISLIPPVQGG